MSRTSLPSNRTLPPVGSKSLGTIFTTVLFPDPVGPMIAVVVPRLISMSMPDTASFAPEYAKETPSNLTAHPSSSASVSFGSFTTVVSE